MLDMTNAEKYLKDEVNILELWKNFSDYYYKNKTKESDAGEAFKLFFWEQVTPTLTDDEKTILRHISKEYTEIGRDSKEELYLVEMVDTIHSGKYLADIFADDVFAFIKVGEQYEIKELLKDD